MSKPRRSLRDSIANLDIAQNEQEFVYGKSQEPVPSTATIPPLTLSSSQVTEVPEKQTTVRITVDLIGELNRKLTLLARRRGQSKADLLRGLLRDALEKEGIQ